MVTYRLAFALTHKAGWLWGQPYAHFFFSPSPKNTLEDYLRKRSETRKKKEPSAQCGKTMFPRTTERAVHFPVNTESLVTAH